MPSQEVILITGASSGIGATFARRLATRGYNLILVARRKERLTNLVSELEQQYPVTAEILVADLSQSAGIEQVEKRITELESLAMLINNAGFGTTDNFANIVLSRQLEMVQLHVVASMRLSRAALPGMIAHHRGTIINVSSVAAFIPMPRNVTYCATKAFLNTFSEALQAELTGTGVQIQALCPGFTYTEFHDTTEFENYKRARIPKVLWMSAESVVDESLNALKRGQVIFIPGLKYRLLVAVIRAIPNSLLRWGMARRKSVKNDSFHHRPSEAGDEVTV
jgi:short-subunit dehydrogenase